MFYNVIVGGGRSLSKTYSSSLFRRQNIFRIPITKKKTSSFRFYLKIKTKFSIEKKNDVILLLQCDICQNIILIQSISRQQNRYESKIDIREARFANFSVDNQLQTVIEHFE